MKVIIYLLVILVLCSLTKQDKVDSDIQKNFFIKIKTLLNKRGSFDYKNNILNPKNIVLKSFITDRIELNNAKITEIGKRYNLEARALDQIRAAFFHSQPNVYKNFEFSLNSADLNQMLDNAVFSEYIGCCFRQGNMINYMIMKLSINTQIYEQKYTKKWCIFETEDRRNIFPHPLPLYYVRQKCLENLDCYECVNGRKDFDVKLCPKAENQLAIAYRRPLNQAEKLNANNLIRAYSGEMFNLMIEEIQKKTAPTPDKNLEVQSFFTSGQVFKNESYCVQAEITDYGDVEIKEICSTHVQFDKKCENENLYSYLYILSNCLYKPLCDERKSEYLIADKDGKSSCTKLKELRKTKMGIKMEIFVDGSMAIKQGEGILFYAKPNVKGKGPFSVGVTKRFELQIIDSQKVVVWKSTPVFIHDIGKK